MNRASHDNDSDAFGKPMSGSLTGLNPPMIGAASAIIVDGIVEQESGITPAPPSITLRTVAIVVGMMFVLGLVAFFVFLGPQPLPAGTHTALWLEIDSRFEFTSEPDEYGEVHIWHGQPGPDTVYSIDGAEVGEAEFADAFPPNGALRVSVTAASDGTIDQVNAETAHRRSD